MSRGLVFASVVAVAALSGCSKSPSSALPNGKILLNVSLAEKERLFARLGFTNVVTHGPVERDSLGTRIFVTVETGSGSPRAQELRTQQLIVVTADGVHVSPWHFPANEKVTDDEKVALWQSPTNYAYQVRSGEWLPIGHHPEDVSGDWIAVATEGRRAWIAKLDAPNVPLVELPDSHDSIQIFSSNQVVHVFARRGWQNAEGPMRYYLYDFARNGSQPVKEMTLSWARIAIEMDPDSGLAVINDNNDFWGRTWLLDLNTGERKSIAISDWTIIVKKEVAQKWVELTKP
jgi:hypothetical protein